MTVPESSGLSQRDLILEVRKDVRDLARKFEERNDSHQLVHDEFRDELARRPSRSELVGLFVIGGAVAGAILALAQLFVLT